MQNQHQLPLSFQNPLCCWGFKWFPSPSSFTSSRTLTSSSRTLTFFWYWKFHFLKFLLSSKSYFLPTLNSEKRSLSFFHSFFLCLAFNLFLSFFQSLSLSLSWSHVLNTCFKTIRRLEVSKIWKLKGKKWKKFLRSCGKKRKKMRAKKRKKKKKKKMNTF